jgi:hypothetical protein
MDTSSSWVSRPSVIHNSLFLQSLESPGSSLAWSTTNANRYKIGRFSSFVYPRCMLIYHLFIDAYNCPVAPYVSRGFQYLSVLSNAQDQHPPKNFLCPLPNVQGVAYLSQPFPQTAVLHPCTHLSRTLNTFASFWLKMSSQVNFTRVNCFAFRCQHYELIVHVFLNMFNHVCAISKNCYLFHHLTMLCPTLVHLRMQKSFFLRHDFKARMLKLSKKSV